MKRSLIAGLVLAVVAALMILLSDPIGLDLQHVALLGGALGAVVALVKHDPPWGKLAGFIMGFVVTWIGFAVRAAVFPDTSVGRAWTAFFVVAVIGLVCAFSARHLPLWSALVGAAALVGAYEETYTAAPSQFLTDSPGAATTVLLASAFGYLVTTLISGEREEAARDAASRDADPREPAGAHRETAHLDTIFSGENK